MATPRMEGPFRSQRLIGRDREVQQLSRALDIAKEGRGQVALVSGEAGIGKSRLIHEFIQQSDASVSEAVESDCLTLIGHCYEQDRGAPCAPFVDLLRRLDVGQLQGVRHLEQLLKLVPDLAARFPDVRLAPTAEPEQERRNLFEAWVRLLVEGANRSDHPASCRVIVFEDLHWCDDVSLDLLLVLARRIAQQPTLLALTYRSDEITPALGHFLATLERERLAHEIVLEPLAPKYTRDVIQAIFNQVQVRTEFLDVIQARTEGNPFFIEETLKSLVASGDIYTERGVWTRKPLRELSIPRTVQDAVQRRAQTLSEPSKRVLAVAAVAGQRFQFPILREASQMSEDDLLACVRELISAQLIVESTADEFAFRHALTREAVYVTLLKRERRKLHLAVGEVLRTASASASASDAALAYHFFEAEAWAEALTYARRAGEQAQALFAPREAIEQFTRAIKAASFITPGGEGSRVGSLHRARAQAHETLGHFEEACADYEATLTVGDQRAKWESLFSLGFLWTGRDMGKARAYLDRALDVARQLNDPAALGASLNRIGNWRLNMEQSDAALALHRESLHIFVALNDEAGQALTNDLLGITNMLRGDFIASVQYHDTAIALFRRLNQPLNLSSSLGTAALRGGCYQSDMCAFPPASADACWQLGSEAIRLAHQIEWRAGEANTNAFLALAMGSRGAYARSLVCARDALDIALEIDNPVWEGVANICMGKTHHDCFAFEMAHLHLEEAVASARRVGAAEFLRTAVSFLASTLIAQGKLEEARALLDELPNRAPADAQTTSQHLAHAVRAELYLAGRDACAALTMVEEMIAALPRLQTDTLSARLGLLRSEALQMLSRPAEAEPALLAAAQAAAEQTLRPLEWRIRVALGRLYRHQRKHDEAQMQFDLARTIVRGLMNELGDEAMRTSLLNGFEAMLPDAPTTTRLRAAKQSFDGLTAREREVATFVAKGMTNKAIAEKLVVSERTIEKHVENAMSKLGFGSRTQLAVWASEKGLRGTTDD